MKESNPILPPQAPRTSTTCRPAASLAPSTRRTCSSSPASTQPLQVASTRSHTARSWASDSERAVERWSMMPSSARRSCTCCSSMTAHSATPRTMEPSSCSTSATSRPRCAASSCSLASLGASGAAPARRPAGISSTRSSEDTAAATSRSCSSTKPTHSSNSRLSGSGSTNRPPAAQLCGEARGGGRPSAPKSAPRGEMRTRRPSLKSAAPT
mmetsp:Transcript_64256/g.171895  ORF Transcript_64256/g.171895 Transcript_64256/m.171895 type:complete len:212 (+) Transcript_64256:619-1254(+)